MSSLNSWSDGFFYLKNFILTPFSLRTFANIKRPLKSLPLATT